MLGTRVERSFSDVELWARETLSRLLVAELVEIRLLAHRASR